jgi:hypothetical protein
LTTKAYTTPDFNLYNTFGGNFQSFFPHFNASDTCEQEHVNKHLRKSRFQSKLLFSHRSYLMEVNTLANLGQYSMQWIVGIWADRVSHGMDFTGYFDGSSYSRARLMEALLQISRLAHSYCCFISLFSRRKRWRLIQWRLTRICNDDMINKRI